VRRFFMRLKVRARARAREHDLTSRGETLAVDYRLPRRSPNVGILSTLIDAHTPGRSRCRDAARGCILDRRIVANFTFPRYLFLFHASIRFSRSFAGRERLRCEFEFAWHISIFLLYACIEISTLSNRPSKRLAFVEERQREERSAARF